MKVEPDMISRDRIYAIVKGEPVDRCGYWTGCPHDDTWPQLYRYFDCSTPEEIYRILGDDIRWIPVGNQQLQPDGCFTECETEADVDSVFQANAS
jgi:hypothetical protein